MNICSMVYIYPVTLCVFLNVYLHAVINKVTLYQCESIIVCVSMGWLGDVLCWNRGCWSLPAYGKGLELLTARLWLFGDFLIRGACPAPSFMPIYGRYHYHLPGTVGPFA